MVDFFLSILYTSVGDIALRTLSYSGVYIIGSLAFELAEYIKEKNDFLVIFINI